MIYTVTLNPSIDYVMHIDEFNNGETIRSDFDAKYPGGKGIMVSKLLKNLGDDPVSLGFVGGYTGEFIVSELNKLSVKENFTRINDDSRINVKLKYQYETEINAAGPSITDDEKNEFLNILADVKDDDVLILSGSIPKSLPQNFYKEILDINKSSFTIDVAGKEILEYLSYHPLLVKPNIDELSSIFETDIDQSNVFEYAKKLNQLDAQNVIVSMGGEGSIFVDENHLLKALPIKGELINSVGAGDSMVAGFIHGIINNMNKEDAYKLAVASGTATAFSPDIATKEKIEEILSKVEVVNYGN